MLSYGRMRWTNVVFVHWRADPKRMAPKIPEGLSLDLRDRSAWVTVAALVGVGPAPKALVGPRSEKLLGYRQLNVRTYVRGRHGQGILLLETLVDSRIAAVGASLLGQPYHFSSGLSISAENRTARIEAPGISLAGAVGGKPARPGAGSLTAWLIERYWAYGRLPGTRYAVRVEHAPWLVRAWKPEGTFEALRPLVGSKAPADAQISNDVEVTIAEVAREGEAAPRRVPVKA